MANADRPDGFTPITDASGHYPGGLVRVAFEDENSVATFLGDLVRLEGSADNAADPNGISLPTVDRSADEDTDHFGVLVGLDPLYTNLETKHRAASTARTGYVVAATNGQLFRIQGDGDIEETDIGNNADILDSGTGNSTTGRSAMEVATAGIGTGENLLILGLYQTPDNDYGANAEVIVQVKENAWATGEGTAGV